MCKKTKKNKKKVLRITINSGIKYQVCIIAASPDEIFPKPPFLLGALPPPRLVWEKRRKVASKSIPAKIKIPRYQHTEHTGSYLKLAKTTSNSGNIHTILL